MNWKKKVGWRDRFITLMVIPERTHKVTKVVVPFFVMKLGLVLFSLSVVFLAMVGMDYVHVLGRMAENKELKGENFKLRQEMQVIRNKVDTMESTIERVRNYAKKLQMLTGQGDKTTSELPWGPTEGEDTPEREPASSKNKPLKHSRLDLPEEPEMVPVVYTIPAESPHFSLEDRVDRLEKLTFSTESGISKLHVSLLAKRAVINATPSMVPILGWMSSTFGYRRNPYDGSFKLHAGVDIAAEPGTPVRAPADGHVIFSGYREGYGKVVVLDHGYGIQTVFAHNSKLFANMGARIKRGETISQVGSTGHSTGPHLHYEIRKNGIPVNPATFFTRTRF